MLGLALLVWLARRLRRRRLTKLIVHFDVNETIMVGDPAGGDSFEDCLNKMICKNAFVRTRSGSGGASAALAAKSLDELCWWDGTPLCTDAEPSAAPPPLVYDFEWPEGCVPFYKVECLKKAHAKRFTEPGKAGCVYRQLYEQLEQAMRLPAGQEGKVDKRLTLDGVHWFLLPAFFLTLHHLHRSERDFGLIVRTFGTDGPAVGRALNAWSEGLHPTVPGVTSMSVDPERDLWRGAYSDDGSFSLRREPPTDPAAVAGNAEQAERLEEDAALAMMQERASAVPRAVVCADHYEWWKAHHYSPAAGKPLWVDTSEEHMHHIFFDDNIHNDPDDSIIAVRMRHGPAGRFQPLSGEATRTLQGMLLVRTPTPLPILDRRWFLKQIERCETARLSRFKAMALQHKITAVG